LLWPKLVERAPDQAGEVRRVAGQHDQVTAELERAAVRVEEFRATPSDDAAVAAAEAISALGAALLPHLDEEEAFIVPLAAQHIFAPEWGELPGHALRTFGGDKLWLALGLIREQMRPEQLAMMDEHMPPPVLAMWRANESAFAAFVSELRES
jgi:hypothetical protein